MMNILENKDAIIQTAKEILTARRKIKESELLTTAVIAIEETGYDNWNGGTYYYTFYIRIPASEYALIGDKQFTIENTINKAIRPIIEQYSDDSYSVKLAPLLSGEQASNTPEYTLRTNTRKLIVEYLITENITWHGNLNEVEFLERIFDLRSIPSHDQRYSSAAQDIWQHRVNNPSDWDDDWIFHDDRFPLLTCPDKQFIMFLCEMVHPIVRRPTDETIKLIGKLNDYLTQDGWQIIAQEGSPNRPHYVGHRINSSINRALTNAKSIATSLDAGWMHKEIARLETCIYDDPSLAIGTAKDLVETCCKTILGRSNITYSHKADLSDLAKLVTKSLNIVPEGIPEEVKGSKAIKILLSNFITIVQRLAEIRGLYGSGHGRDGKYRGLQPRHAKLAAATAIAFIEFVTETYSQRQSIQNES